MPAYVFRGLPPGKTVTVRKADGTTATTGTVAASGDLSVTLDVGDYSVTTTDYRGRTVTAVEELVTPFDPQGAASGTYEPRASALAFIDFQSVAANQARTGSDGYTDLTTVGPSVTFTVPVGEVWDIYVEYSALVWTNASGTYGEIGAALDGSTPEDLFTGRYAQENSSTAGSSTIRASRRFTGLAAGAHTVTMKYRRGPNGTGATANFMNRHLTVWRTAIGQA